MSVMIAGATEAMKGHMQVNGVFDPTGELSGGRPVYRKRGNGEVFIHFWLETKKWIVAKASSVGKDRIGWAFMCFDGTLEACAGLPWKMTFKDSEKPVEQPGVILRLESSFSVASLSSALSAVSSHDSQAHLTVSPSPPTPTASLRSPASAQNSIIASSPVHSSPPFASSTHDNSHHLLQTEYRGVISIVASYTPPHSCSHAMLHDLKAVLPQVVRMDFIARECVTKAETVLQRLPPGVVKLPMDMAVAVSAYTYDLGICSATSDGRYLGFASQCALADVFAATTYLWPLITCCVSATIQKSSFPLLYHFSSPSTHPSSATHQLTSCSRAQLLKARDFLFYLMKGLEQLPAANETVYRGIPGSHLAMVRSKYLLGSDVHWSAFNSTSTSIEKAKRFAHEPVCSCAITVCCLNFSFF